MSAQITFSGGAQLVVSEDPDVALETLERDKQQGNPFSRLSDSGGREVHVAPEQVAYVGAAPYGS